MEYDKETVSEIFDELGEVMFVLESDREYELHTRNVELEEDRMIAKGLRNEDGELEWVEVFIPYDTIEHYYTHKAV